LTPPDWGAWKAEKADTDGVEWLRNYSSLPHFAALERESADLIEAIFSKKKSSK